MNFDFLTLDEWTQKEYLKYKEILQKEHIEVLLVDTINKPIAYANTVLYNPFELKKYPKGSVFVFYCDSGKTSKERLAYYRLKFEGYYCISLRGGRGYFRPFLQLHE